MSTRFAWALLGLWVTAFLGCASGLASERAAGALELSGLPDRVERARLWMTSTEVRGGDGMQGRAIGEVSAELTDLVNQAMVDQLRRGAGRAGKLAFEVPPEAAFGRPVTFPPSNFLDPQLLSASIWAASPPARDWSMALRNEVEYNVFSDSVELQLASVITLFDAGGEPQWQAAVRSRKYYDNWTNGEHLAALSAKFVMESARENAKRLLRYAK